MKVYILECEDLSNLGGPMGTEDTSIVWTLIFRELENAKKYALDWISKRHKKKVNIIWKKRDNVISSNDLGSHMFHIRKERIR